MVILKNEVLTVKINEVGAEIKSILSNGTEYIWEGRKEVWGSSAPLLFPICGSLKEDKYVFEGNEYKLAHHGFARYSTFAVEESSDEHAVFHLKSSEETKKVFPFDFELRVIYTINGASVKIEYRVDNKSNKNMFFSIGSHEGYYTPEGIEDYDVVFPQNETLNTYLLYGSLLSNQTMPIIKESNVLPLYEKYFILDTLVFKDLKSRSAILRNRKTGKGIKLDFGFAPYLLLWHNPNSPYMCIEPWAGLPDIVGSDYDITKKAGIIELAPTETYTAEHTITIL